MVLVMGLEGSSIMLATELSSSSTVPATCLEVVV